LEQAAQGSGGVSIPGGVEKTCRCGTLGHGLAGMVVLGWQLDLMTLEVFSNLNHRDIESLWSINDSVILTIGPRRAAVRWMGQYQQTHTSTPRAAETPV